MSSRNRSLFYSIFITVLIAGTVIYLYGLKPDISSPSPAQLFMPNDIVQLSWIYQNSNFNFSRATDSSTWTPAADQTRIDSKIKMLSNLTNITEIPEGLNLSDGLTVQLKFKTGETWSGIYANQYFVWTTGPHTQKASALSATELEIFNEGRFAFEPLTWEWCSDKLHKIIYEVNEEAIELQKSGDEWQVTNLTGDAKIVETNWVTEWIEKSCRVEVQAWVDLRLEPFGLDEGNFEIFESDRESQEYLVKTPMLQIQEEKALLSPLLFQNLDELIQAP